MIELMKGYANEGTSTQPHKAGAAYLRQRGGGLVTEFRNTKLLNKPDLLNLFDNLSASRQADFFYDFERQGDDVLNKLSENNGELFNRWDLDEIVHFKPRKRDVIFLEAYNVLKKDLTLQKHLFVGDIRANGKVGGIHTKIAVYNGHAIINSIVDPPDFSGIYRAHITAVDANGNIFAKKDYLGDYIDNDMFPDAWDEDRIIEEVALAFTNKQYLNGNKYIGIMSNGSKCTICINYINNMPKIITVWPNRL